MTAIVETREQIEARRAALLAACRLGWAELCQRADDWTLTPEERAVYETVRTLDWLLGEDEGEA